MSIDDSREEGFISTPTGNAHMSQVFEQVIKRIEEENRANNVRLMFHGFLAAAMIFSLLFSYITQDCPR